MSESSQPDGAIRSDFADDTEMSELIELFVEDMQNRIDELEAAWRDADAEALERAAHQLKGASAGYGFPIVGDAAGRLEATIKAAERDLSSAASEFNQLIDLCSRAAA